MNIFLAIVALSFLILIHELGHFLVARHVGIKVLEFSIFMGPRLFSWKRGETEYSIRAIPMGGFVKMEGEEEESSDDRAFNKKSPGKRALVVVAGATMNILIAIIIMTIVTLSMGYNTRSIHVLSENSALAEAGLQAGDTIVSYDNKHIFHPNDLYMFLYPSQGEPVEAAYRREGVNGLQRTMVTPKKTAPAYQIGIGLRELPDGRGSNIIGMVQADSPAEKAGLIQGDVILKVDEVTVTERNDLAGYLQQSKDKPVEITVDRKGETITVHDLIPVAIESYYDLGVGFEYKKGSFFGSIASSINYSISIIRSVYYSLGWLITGVVSFKEVSGPVGIVTYIGEAVESGQGFSEKFLNLLQMVVFLSLNLGVMNLMPFPALDGGKLALILLEKIRRKPIPPEKEAWISMIGFVLLMLVLAATLFNDIPKIFKG